MNYPVNYMYQQPYNQPYQDRMSQLQAQYSQNMQQAPQLNQGILWVQGEAGAKSYLVTPNTTVLLMDSESQRFYLKTTDISGMPNLRTFEYSEVTYNGNPQKENMDTKYVTREEYNELKKQNEEILGKLNMIESEALSRSKGGNTNEQSDI